jgi:glycosyltransferase involved in cell wall biosynthesis
LDSILAQTYNDFELLVIDDGSLDGTAAILEDYRTRDPRVRIESNETNTGLTKSLNRGINLARGKYIARMDADDVALPERLARQVAFMEANEQVGVCGTWAVLLGEGEGHLIRFPTNSETIRCQLMFDNPLAHPTTIIRKQMLKKNGISYDEHFTQSQDYDLWVRCAERMELANIPEALLRLRKHESQLSQTLSNGQNVTAWEVRKRQIERLGIEPTKDNLDIHLSICSQIASGDAKYILSANAWLQKLLAANNSIGFFPVIEFRRIIASYWLRIYMLLTRGNLAICRSFISSPLRRSCDLRLLETLLLCLRCLFKR